jgi:hypothetical protein
MNTFGGLTAPLSVDNCYYFSIWSLVSLVIFLGVIIMAIFKAKKDPILATILTALSPLIGYYVNRLLYSMCIQSLK